MTGERVYFKFKPINLKGKEMLEFKTHLGIWLLLTFIWIIVWLLDDEKGELYSSPWVPVAAAGIFFAAIEFVLWVIYLCFVR